MKNEIPFLHSENKENLTLLKKFIHHASKGFGLCICPISEQNRIIDNLLQEKESNPIISLNLMELKINITGLQEEIQNINKDNAVVLIHHIEPVVETLNLRFSEYLERLNLIRDFFGHFPYIFVFFFLPPSIKQLMSHAFDFYDWIKVTFYFQEEYHTPTELLFRDFDIVEKENSEKNDRKINYITERLKEKLPDAEKNRLKCELGVLYIKQRLLDKAEEIFKILLAANNELKTVDDTLFYCTILHNSSKINELRGKYDKALEYLKKSLSLNQKIGNRDGIFTTTHNIAHIFLLKKDIKQAIDYFQMAFTIAQKIDHPFYQFSILRDLGQTFVFKTKKKKEGFQYLKRAIVIGEKYELPETEKIKTIIEQNESIAWNRDPFWYKKLDRVSQLGTLLFLTKEMLQSDRNKMIAFLWYGMKGQGIDLFHERISIELKERFKMYTFGEIYPVWPSDFMMSLKLNKESTGDTYRNALSKMIIDAFNVRIIEDIPLKIRKMSKGSINDKVLIVFHHETIRDRRILPIHIKLYISWLDEILLKYLDKNHFILAAISFEVQNPNKFKAYMLNNVFSRLNLNNGIIRLLDEMKPLNEEDIADFFWLHNIQIPMDSQNKIINEVLLRTQGDYEKTINELNLLFNRF